MSYLKRQGGVTLVELVLVLAITAGAIASAIAVRSSLQKDISFSTSIEQVKNQIIAAKTESVQSVKDGSGGAGNTDASVFGKIVEFDPGDKFNMKVSTLIEGEYGPSGSTVQRLAKCDTRTVLLKDQVEYKGTSKQSIVFKKSPDQIFVPPANYNENEGPTCAALAMAPGTHTPDYGGYDSDNDGIPDAGDDCPNVPGPGTPNGCPSGDPPDPQGCDAPGYVCGLYGRFYSELHPDSNGVPDAAGDNNLRSAFNGEQLGLEYSVHTTWAPILRYRTTKNPAAEVAAKWTGQVRVPANATRNICLNTDDGSYMEINGQVVTSNYNSHDQAANRCRSFPGGSIDTWYDIVIVYPQRDSTEMTPFISLTYQNRDLDTGGWMPEIFVPLTDLRSPPGQEIWPHNAYAWGLRGEYFNNNTLAGEPFSVYTDSDALLSPYESDSSFTNIVKDRTGQKSADNFSASIRWSGQVDMLGGSPQLCFNYHNGLRVEIAGVVIVDDLSNTTAGKNTCVDSAATGGGWRNITIESRKNNSANTYLGVGFTLDGGQPEMRRSSDFVDTTYKELPTVESWSGALSQCSDLADSRYVSYSKNSLQPSSNYKLDINYQWNHQFSDFFAPAYICIKVDGQLINAGQPYRLDYAYDDQGSIRTESINNISVSSSGVLDLKIAHADPACAMGFCLDSLDIYSINLWRGFNSNGALISGADQQVNEPKTQSLAQAFFKLISLPVNAAIADCPGAPNECSILIPDNYTTISGATYSFYPDEAEFLFGIGTEPYEGKIIVNPPQNSISREIGL